MFLTNFRDLIPQLLNIKLSASLDAEKCLRLYSNLSFAKLKFKCLTFQNS